MSQDHTTQSSIFEANLRAAIRCGCEPSLALTVAAASLDADSVSELVATLANRSATIEAICEHPEPLKRLEELEPEFKLSAEIAAIRPEIMDHELRGRLLFRDIVGKMNFWQVAVWMVAGVDISAGDAALLDELAVSAQLADVRIWPLAVTRRVARRNGFARGVVAGLACLLNRNMGPMPVAACMQWLLAAKAEHDAQRLEGHLAALVARGKLAGVGRPVLKRDERVVPMLATLEKFGRAEGSMVKLAHVVNAELLRTRSLELNAAGWAAATLADIGLTPQQARAVVTMFFFLPVLAQATASE